MKAAYLKAPYMFEVRDVELREIKDTEVIVDVKACGFCGHDNILAPVRLRTGSLLAMSFRESWKRSESLSPMLR